MSESQAPSRLDRLLRTFADVRPGEGATALLLACNVFLILTAYYVLKPVREALILGSGSPELKTYMSLGQIALLAFAVPWYGRLANRLQRRTLINSVTWFFVGCLAIFYLTGRAGLQVGIAYYLWIGVFNLMIVAQFWSFANDIYSRPQGERLFPLVGFGASAGAVLGALVASQLIQWLGIYELLLIGAAILVLELQITNYVDRQNRSAEGPAKAGHYDSEGAAKAGHYDEPQPTETSPTSGQNSFGLVLRTPYLLLIALMLMVLSTVDALGEYVLASIVKDAAEAEIAAGAPPGTTLESIIGAFYSHYFAMVNGVSLLVQLFVVSRLVKLLGVGHAVVIQPLLSVLAYTSLVLSPVLSVVLFAKVAEKSADYSLGNTVRNMLFLPCSREEKYSAKQAIDSFFYRMGDVISAAVVFVGALLALGTRSFAVLNVLLAGVFLLLAVLVGRAYARRTQGPSIAPPIAAQQKSGGLFKRPVRGAAIWLLILVPAIPAFGQETRAEIIAEQQAKKAENLPAYQPTTFERVFGEVQRRFLEEPGGFFPYLGSVHPGGGFTLGAGYRRHFSEHAIWDIKGLYSLKNYKLIELGAKTTRFANGQVVLSARAGWRDATQVAFFGLGMGTDVDARTNYRFRQSYGGGGISARLKDIVVLFGSVTYEDFRLTEGKGSHPSIETEFTPDTAPGLGDSPAFIHTEATAALDWRTSPGYTRSGGYYRLTLHDYIDIDETYSFDRLVGEAIQHIPILRETWVVSLRARLTTTLDDDDAVPYFLLPNLGGGSSLRAYSSARYADRHSILTSAEWRWIPNRRGLDLALFYDAGKVAPELEDIDFRGLKHDVGIGVRFHGPRTTPLRVELTRGSEGWNVVFSGSPSF